jgi:hypothetical protein
MSYDMADGNKGQVIALRRKKKKHMQIEHARHHLGRHRDPCGGHCTVETQEFESELRYINIVPALSVARNARGEKRACGCEEPGKIGAISFDEWVTVVISGSASSPPRVNQLCPPAEEGVDLFGRYRTTQG